MTRVSRWCTLAGITAALLSLAAAQAFGATGWTMVTPPAFAGSEYYILNGSFALSDTNAWAVGYIGADPVALNWNGTAWSSVPTPTPSGSTPDWMFKAVAASSASDAWAVGQQAAGTKIHDSLYEHWNGTSWSVVTGPNEGVLNAVVDFSPTNAYAFADFATLHWNGTAWSVVSGAPGALGVSADGPNDIWGIFRNNQIIHYNGTSWTVTTLTNAGSTPAFLAVSALSPTDVWVDGTTETDALVEHFNGTSWQVVPTPSSFPGGLQEITAQSASDVWVFSYTGTPQIPITLANWNGSSWTTYPSPVPTFSSVALSSATSSPSHVWLFGEDATAGQALILSFSP
jgi:hypothetical protein